MDCVAIEYISNQLCISCALIGYDPKPLPQ